MSDETLHEDLLGHDDAKLKHTLKLAELQNITKGQRIVYHTGRLASDRKIDPHAAALGSLVFKLVEAGRVRVVQKVVREQIYGDSVLRIFDYIAVGR